MKKLGALAFLCFRISSGEQYSVSWVKTKHSLVSWMLLLILEKGSTFSKIISQEEVSVLFNLTRFWRSVITNQWFFTWLFSMDFLISNYNGSFFPLQLHMYDFITFIFYFPALQICATSFPLCTVNLCVNNFF